MKAATHFLRTTAHIALGMLFWMAFILIGGVGLSGALLVGVTVNWTAGAAIGIGVILLLSMTIALADKIKF